MRSRIVSPLLLSAVTFFAALTPFAQAAVQNRIASAVSGSSRVALPGSVSGHAKHSVDLGAASANRKLTSLSLRFNMTEAQQADLTQLLADQLNPSSPSYHQWLTPEQFGARFGLSSSDLAKVSSWLTSQGFTITNVAHSSTFIEFSGTVAQAEQAFGTTIHSLSLNGEQHISNLEDPVLPSAIAGVVGSIGGLNDFSLKPHSRARNASPVDPAQPLYTQTVCTGSSVPCHYISPADLYTIYNFNPLASPLGGTGVTIGVIGQTDLNTGNVLPDPSITAFRTAAGLPPIILQAKLIGLTDPGVSPSDVDEAHIDIEWSGAAAPGANILYIYSNPPSNGGGGVFQALTSAVDNKLAPIITMSYGNCEAAYGTAALALNNLLLVQANVQGQTVISSSGDSGATDCDATGPATEGLNVDFPSSSPFVTSAGGTMFSGDLSSPTNYWGSANGANGGSVLSYIPEKPWNETTMSGGLSDGGAAGGGVSAFFAKPLWQTGIGVPNDASRDVPDISLNAAAQHDGYLVCSQGGFAGEPACTNTNGGFLGTGNTPNVFGGTSFVAPIFAGVLALVQQKLGAPNVGLGNIGPILYGLANGSNPTSIFNTIQVGNNSVICTQGTPNCPAGIAIGYSANGSPGYNQAAGLGSLNVSNLLNSWKSAIPTGTGGTIGSGITTTSLTTTTSALCAVSAGTMVSLNIAVSGSITPTGTVQILVDNASVGTATLANGATSGTASASFTLNTTALLSGGHNISAVYTGDGNNAGSKGTLPGPAVNTGFYPNGQQASFDIVAGKDFGFTPCTGTATNVTVASGATSSGIILTVTPANGFTGAVTLTATNNDGMFATTTFTPASLTVGSGAVTTSFVVKASQTTTTSQLSKTVFPHSRTPLGNAPWYAAGSGASLACLLLITLPRRRRWGALLAAVISVAALTAVGCGGGNTSTSGGTGTGTGGGGGGGGTGTTNAVSGTYTFTITAVAGTLVHSTQVTVTVP
jgi:subtilase family serine protease